ncbi:MAG: hypothetical protein WEB02_03365 [Methylophaga sp.]
MNKLILQIIIRQWDKSQRSEQDTQARNALPDRYPVNIPPAKSLFDDRVIIDQHGDDLSGNRLQYQLLGEFLIIDHFRFDLNKKTVEFKNKLTADANPLQLGTLGEGWQQFQYHWRYRIEHNQQIFWLYEDVILNSCFTKEPYNSVFLGVKPCKKTRLTHLNKR